MYKIGSHTFAFWSSSLSARFTFHRQSEDITEVIIMQDTVMQFYVRESFLVEVEI